ncbi:uncharacterized protein LOC116411744 [Xenopus tropicalis]|uniref:Uncharacterized protein LOC116411744 n=1 Tax=Xenopus tropicalis TaxID=8364 RepID=A0A8J1JTT2_XENTR|nr:uncharacterized protein LOC116411744 [Xenopus tropicalis]
MFAVDVIYLDIVKVFDTVPHRCLLFKLISVGSNACFDAKTENASTVATEDNSNFGKNNSMKQDKRIIFVQVAYENIIKGQHHHNCSPKVPEDWHPTQTTGNSSVIGSAAPPLRAASPPHTHTRLHSLLSSHLSCTTERGNLPKEPSTTRGATSPPAPPQPLAAPLPRQPLLPFQEGWRAVSSQKMPSCPPSSPVTPPATRYSLIKQFCMILVWRLLRANRRNTIIRVNLKLNKIN